MGTEGKQAKKDKGEKKEKKEGEKRKREPDAGDADADKARRKEEKRAKAAAAAGADGARPAAAGQPAASAADAAYRAEHQITVGEGTDLASLPPCVLSIDAAPFVAPLVSALRAAGYSAPTPIQAQGWPIALSGCDLIAVAKTGSGKTVAFLLPTLHTLSRATPPSAAGGLPSPRALVLAPTRELAAQIEAEAVRFGKAVGCTSVCLYGGAPVNAQKAALARTRPDVVVATPGRLVDLLNQGSLSLQRAAIVTLDEADRMLDMGFEPQITQIFAALPTERQTLCFTATWPKSIRKLAATFLRADRTRAVFIGGGADAELEANRAVSQLFVHATDDEKDRKLYDFLCALPEGSRVVVFANTKRRVENLSKTFYNEGFGTCAIHGDKKQHERDAALAQFVANQCPLMFATDVAARGLDIKGVTHVLNFDMAKDVESYVHRIGRTGRAGELGASVTFWNPDYDKECAPALVKLARDAGQPVPDWLLKFEKVKASKQWKVEDARMDAPPPKAGEAEQ
jgi:superfamily II DNA/RNA helicase